MSDYLLKGAISNALNFPSISAEEAPKLKPFVKLAEQLARSRPNDRESAEEGAHRVRWR